ncbi:MAG: 3-phosphoshikimate 1-carboxyvinyltransferase [Acidimicrobiales bacterium]
MTVDALTVTGGVPLTGSLAVPGDKSISHRALLLAALAEGTSTIHGLADGDDVTRTRQAVAALGAGVEQEGTTVTVRGGRSRLAAPAAPVDLGNSGTAIRLLAGLVAGLDGTTTLTGDPSLRRRPMDRVATPLTAMGAHIEGQGDDCLPPLTVTGGHLHAIRYSPPMASAQVKSAVLLAGLDAHGETVVEEPVATRAHTEEMLQAMGAKITFERVGGGRVIRLVASDLRSGTFTVPGDPSQAAFWLVGAVLVPGSLVSVTDVQLGIERLGFLGVLRRMAATVEVEEVGNAVGTITASTCRLHGTVVESAEIPSLDEVPVLTVAASAALGRTVFHDVGELRSKESDRLNGSMELARAFGADATVDGDDLIVDGVGGPLRPAGFDASGDHRMAMAAAVAGMACADWSTSTITGWAAVDTSYPGFADDLRRLTDPAESRS